MHGRTQTMTNNNIPELKQSIWQLVETCATLSGKSTAVIVKKFTTSMSFPNGKTFDELKSKWNLCSFRSKLDRYYSKELDHDIYKWYREGVIEKNPEPVINNFVSSVGEGAPPRKADGSYDTWGT